MKLIPKKLTCLALAAVLTLTGTSIPVLANTNSDPIVNMVTETSQIDNGGNESVAARVRGLFTIVTRAFAVYSKGEKISERVEEAEIEDAIKEHFGIQLYTSGRNLKKWNVGRGKNVILEAGDDSTYGMEHILAKHVPKYFNQYDDAEKAMRRNKDITFFDKNTDVGDVFENLDYVINKYKSRISQRGFKNGKEDFTVEGKDGKDYILVIKDGEVITFYPDRWNRADIFETYQGPGIPV